jgi:hypothetical protein
MEDLVGDATMQPIAQILCVASGVFSWNAIAKLEEEGCSLLVLKGTFGKLYTNNR